MIWLAIKFWAPICAFAATLIFYVLRIRLSWHGKILVMLLMSPLFFRIQLMKFLGIDVLSPNLPQVVNWVWCWFYISMMFLAMFSVLFFFSFRHRAILLPLAALAIGGYGVWSGVRAPDGKVIELAFDNLPKELDGYKIVQLTDVHCSGTIGEWKTRAIVETANEFKPDLICLTGDLADGKFELLHRAVVPFKELSARDGVLACTGNHEYFYETEKWIKFYESLGMKFLRNECVSPHSGLVVGGVNDRAGAGRKKDSVPNVRKAFAKAGKSEFRILLQHHPEIIPRDARARENVSLQLSGHTHGGLMPGVREIIAHLNGGYTRGIMRDGNSVLYVSPGCGQCEWFPLRILNDSEVTCIILRSKQGRANLQSTLSK